MKATESTRLIHARDMIDAAVGVFGIHIDQLALLQVNLQLVA
jgi:hypothetical protein